MYRPRHARPSRVRTTPVLGALLLTPLALQPWHSAATGTPKPAAQIEAAPVEAFDAQPLVVPLPTTVGRQSQGSQLPSRAALLLPATVLQGERFGPDTRAVPAAARAAYRAAAAAVARDGCELPTKLLAAVGAVVSDHGRRPRVLELDGRRGYLMADTDHGLYDGSNRIDSPVGPMGLLPWTFVQVRATTTADPSSLPDAALAAARFLCAADRDLQPVAAQRAALLSYDADPSFGAAVLATERAESASR